MDNDDDGDDDGFHVVVGVGNAWVLAGQMDTRKMGLAISL